MAANSAVLLWRNRIRWASGKAIEVLRDDGATELVRRSRAYLSQRIRSGPRVFASPDDFIAPSPALRGVLILAGHEPPQCVRYRVLAKNDLASPAAADVPLFIVSPQQRTEALSLLQMVGTLLIFRLPDHPVVRELAAEARRLGIPVVYEVDDLVHRRESVAANPNVQSLSPRLRDGVIAGADGYLAALRLCDFAIASTPTLAHDLAAEVGGDAFVVSNAIDSSMLEIANRIDAARAAGQLREPDGIVRILYGSGSLAHDDDLALAAGALARILHTYPQTQLWLLGPVSLPLQLEAHAGRVRRLEAMPFDDYLSQLASADITIAPLLSTDFNRFKSQVKYLEAALVGTPLVASPTVYAEYAIDGDTALIAHDEQQWVDALSRLIEDPDLRARLAHSARTHVERWHTTAQPATQFTDAIAAIQGWGEAS